RDGNGRVTGAEEVTFIDDLPDARSDLGGLRAFDSNADGRLDAADERFAGCGVWRDACGDGAVGGRASLSLAQAGVVSISLNGSPVDGAVEFGEVAILNAGTFTRTDGTTGRLADAALTYFSGASSGRGRRAGLFDWEAYLSGPRRRGSYKFV